MDGANLIARPWEEIEQIQDFLGLPREITRESFVQPKFKKGYYCLKVGSLVTLITLIEQLVLILPHVIVSCA